MVTALWCDKPKNVGFNGAKLGDAHFRKANIKFSDKQRWLQKSALPLPLTQLGNLSIIFNLNKINYINYINGQNFPTSNTVLIMLVS